jgi:hypothetical protein
MSTRVHQIASRLTLAVAASILFAADAAGQEFVLIACENQNRCTYRQAFAPSMNTSDSVRLFPPSTVAGAVGKGQTVRLSTIAGLYREPASGALRLLGLNGELGAVVQPAKVPRGATGDGVAWTIEYREQLKSKVRVPVTSDQFVALVRGPRLDRVAIEFVKRETMASTPHPRRPQLITGALAFTAQSEELQRWRTELVQTIRQSLDSFRKETVDPALLEATLAGGFSAIGIFRQIAPDAPEQALQEELIAEYRRLRERFAIARVLKNSNMHDAFLDKLAQIGLARWSRPDLLADAGHALETSAKAHEGRASQLYAAKQFDGAFDEAEVASTRLPCNEAIADLYYQARIVYVNQNKIPARPDHESDDLSMLQQIVRELQGIAQEPALTPERKDYVRRRIAEGERRGKDYLPLQLKKAEFLASIGELSASRNVVTQVERTVSLGRNEADEWLQMDARLNTSLLTLRQEVDGLATRQIANGEFKEAIETAARGLAAEPENPRFLYLSAVAASVLREHELARQFVLRYLRRTAGDCAKSAEVTATMFDLYRKQPPAAGASATGDRRPNWISGELYPAGEVSYDSISGSFNPRIISSVVMDSQSPTSTHFVWEGYLATAIRTTAGINMLDRQTQLDLEPVYEQKRVYMSGIGTRSNSDRQRRIMPLRYMNSPDYDPALAARFTNQMSTRGWAGNPFFHPFLWTDIFLFDFEYDELGRLKLATPVTSDPSRPVSPFSEPLTFTWEGNTRRLLAITGARYRRELVYDDNGLLVEEKIKYPRGKGQITYSYRGKPAQLIQIFCEDDFYDRARRRVVVAPPHR